MQQIQQKKYVFGHFNADIKEQLLAEKAILCIDENVFQQHEQLFKDFYKIILPSGEAHKNQHTVHQIYNELIAFEADRSTLLVGIGGGVATDITGFVAATYMRGLRCGFIPTTLLAQVDASIGGKNGIDIGVYKNLVGTFLQPEFVFFDTHFLRTLPQQEWINGCAEMIKHACIQDEQLFALLQQHVLTDLQANEKLLLDIIQKNVFIKKRIIEKDPFEKGERKLLNFGHTLGHAIENTYQLFHGQAVAIGMYFACQLSQHLSTFSTKETQQVQNLIHQYHLPHIYSYDIEKIFSILKMDKKRERNDIHFVLLERIGKAHTHKISINDLHDFLAQS